jgi:preprotein translocase SecE subunit
MADQTPKKKGRLLRQATETMRERAERTASTTQQKRGKRIVHTAKAPLRGMRRLGHLPIWKPFKSRPVRFIGRVLFPRYFRASWRELRQVTWPNGKQTRQLTGAVIMFSVIFGMVVAAFDYGLDKLFRQVIIK